MDLEGDRFPLGGGIQLGSRVGPEAVLDQHGQLDILVNNAGITIDRNRSGQLRRGQVGVAPGFIATEMVSAMPEEALSRVVAQIPVGRLGEPDEIARVEELLADPDSGYITGEIIDINGGLYM